MNNPLCYISPKAKTSSVDTILAKVYMTCNECGQMTPILEYPGEGFSNKKFKCVHCGSTNLHFEKAYRADRQGRILDNPVGVSETPLSYHDLQMALKMRDRYKDDVKAGHTGATEYWRGQAAAYFTGNPMSTNERGKLIGDIISNMRMIQMN